MNPDGAGSDRDGRPEVTVLCGFLGAGKTTLLTRLLEQREGERWALVVNDLAALNVDAREIAARLAERGDAKTPVVELGNGCVCCSTKDDLAESLAELALRGRRGGPEGEPVDRIVVETTGVAEPRGIANLFLRRNPFGRSLGDLARLQALVTVVDLGELQRLLPGGDLPPRRTPAGSGPRPLLELLLEQIEVADVVVLNKLDRVTPDERERLRRIVAGLNPRADLLETEHGQVARESLLDRIRFDARETLGAARWLQSLNALAPGARGGVREWISHSTSDTPERRYADRFGLGSVVFQARRPLRGEAFRRLVTGGLPGVVRAKGYYWLAEQPDEMGFLSIAGDQVRLDTLNYWWAALVESGRVRLDDRPAMVQALWQEPWGDRRQEMVFIGVGLDEDAVRRALEGCLVEA